MKIHRSPNQMKVTVAKGVVKKYGRQKVINIQKGAKSVLYSSLDGVEGGETVKESIETIDTLKKPINMAARGSKVVIKDARKVSQAIKRKKMKDAATKKQAREIAKKATQTTTKKIAKETSKELVKDGIKVGTTVGASAVGSTVGPIGTIIGWGVGEVVGEAMEYQSVSNSRKKRMIKLAKANMVADGKQSKDGALDAIKDNFILTIKYHIRLSVKTFALKLVSTGGMAIIPVIMIILMILGGMILVPILMGNDARLSSGNYSVVYYNQADEPWGSHPYGSSGTIRSSGCGPTSMAICISTLTGEEVTPIDVADWAVDNGYRSVGHGSTRTLIPAAAEHWGLECEDLGNDKQKFITALSEGKLVVALMGPGHFTRGGHFIVFTGIDANGQLTVADCGSRDRTSKTWDIDLVLAEAKSPEYGGPLWSIYTTEGFGINYTLTGYCPCKKCCGKWSNPSNPTTSSGTRATAGRTIAADTDIYPYGTEIVINGHTYTVEDTGSAINGYHFDIYFNTHDEARAFGKQTTYNVRVVK